MQYIVQGLANRQIELDEKIRLKHGSPDEVDDVQGEQVDANRQREFELANALHCYLKQNNYLNNGCF